MSTTRSRAVRVRTIALLGGGVAAGVIGASAFGASAQTVSGVPSTIASASSSSSSSGSTTTGSGSRTGNSNETAVTGAKAATLKANALKKVPGATVDSVTTEDPAEGTGAAFEVHLTKSDGTRETLLFKADLTYLSTETGGGHGGRGGRGGGAGETAVTGTTATTLKTEALKQVPGATVDAVTTDSGDAAYEVHLTKSDGTEVTVKFDKNLKFVNVETGRGK